MLLERLDAILVVRMVRQDLRYLAHIGVLEILEEPDQSPRVITGARTDIRAGDVGSLLHVSGVAEGMQLAKKKDSQHVRASGAKENGSSDFSSLEFVLFLHQRHGVVMDGVGNLVTQRSREFFGILNEIQQRVDDIHVAAWSCERVRLSFMHQVELERVVVPRLRRSRDRVRNWFQYVVQRG